MMMKKLIPLLILFPLQIFANTFPTDNPHAISLTSHNNSSRSFESLTNGISVRIPSSEPNAVIEVYDGDITGSPINILGLYDIDGTSSGGSLQNASGNLEPALQEPLTYNSIESGLFKIYLDPELDGIIETEVPIITVPTTIEMDGVWTPLLNDIVNPDAYNEQLNVYGYFVQFEITQTSVVVATYYKYRANGGLFQLANNSIGISSYSLAPSQPVQGINHYSDGDFVLGFTLIDEVCFLDFIDGDFDAKDDTDDENSLIDLDDVLIAQNIIDINPSVIIDEGVNKGIPLDDSPTFESMGIVEMTLDNVIYHSSMFDFPRSPNVQYVVSGASFAAQNTNPSGNQEIELYRIKSKSKNCKTESADILPNVPEDVEVSSIPAGDYFITILGLDNSNDIFLTASVDVTSVPVSQCQSGQFVSVIFEYLGTTVADVRIEGRSGTIYFDGQVSPGSLIPIAGVDGKVLRGNVDIFIDDELHTNFSTPCSGHFRGENIGSLFSLRSGITNNGHAIQ